MVNTLSGSVCAYRKETVKPRFIRIDEVMALLDVAQDEASTSMSAQQRKLLSYCLYYGFNSTQKAAPSNSQCDEYIATQAMVWVIVADIFGTGSGDSAARKLCNTAPSPDSSYSYYERLRDNISSSYNASHSSVMSQEMIRTMDLMW